MVSKIYIEYLKRRSSVSSFFFFAENKKHGGGNEFSKNARRATEEKRVRDTIFEARVYKSLTETGALWTRSINK